MLDITGTVHNGVIVPDAPIPLPEGAKVRITTEEPAAPEPDPEPDGDPPFRMMREEEWPTTPDGIAALGERWKQHEPPILTPEEEADLAAWRAEMKRYNIEAVRKKMGLPE